MKTRAFILFLVVFILSMADASPVLAQEASSGFSLQTTLSGLIAGSGDLTDKPRDGSGATAGFRAVLYPTWKLNDNWFIYGAYQVYSRPYFYQSFTTQGYGVEGNLIQGYLGYTNHWGGTTLLVRAGELSTAFGSFMLRYDDAANPLINLPLEYGYYYNAVSADSVAGVQADVTAGKWDVRAQLANSSPANPRSPFLRDQYANWTGGGGYTIVQGFRVGASIYHGPYLDRDYAFFFPGESNPYKLPATGVGVDVQYARGQWNLQGEWQHFQMDYHVIPTIHQRTGYAEAKRVLNPRWYLAARVGYLTFEKFGSSESIEAAAGYRPSASQLIKIGYEFNHGLDGNYNTEAIQYVVTLHPISLAFGN